MTTTFRETDTLTISDYRSLSYRERELGWWVDCPRQSNPQESYRVWTGSRASPAHCPCEGYRWAKRVREERTLCIHLNLILYGKGMS